MESALSSQSQFVEPAAIEFAGVSKRFARADGGEVLAVQDVGFSVPAGGIVALFGPSGSGKTTLLNMAAGLIEPDAGDVRIGGKARTAADWGRVGYMFQDDRLLPWRNAANNIGLALEAGRVPSPQRRARALAMLELVGLREFSDAYPHELSGGMRSRIALARSLVTDTDILLMDEPFGRLDAQTRAAMHGQLLALQRLRGLSILFVTHDAEEAAMLADEIIVLSPRPGRILRRVPVPLPRPRAGRAETHAIVADLRAEIGEGSDR